MLNFKSSVCRRGSQVELCRVGRVNGAEGDLAGAHRNVQSIFGLQMELLAVNVNCTGRSSDVHDPEFAALKKWLALCRSRFLLQRQGNNTYSRKRTADNKAFVVQIIKLDLAFFE